MESSVLGFINILYVYLSPYEESLRRVKANE